MLHRHKTTDALRADALRIVGGLFRPMEEREATKLILAELFGRLDCDNGAAVRTEIQEIVRHISPQTGADIAALSTEAECWRVETRCDTVTDPFSAEPDAYLRGFHCGHGCEVDQASVGYADSRRVRC